MLCIYILTRNNVILTLMNDKSLLNKMRLIAELKARDYFSYQLITKKSIEYKHYNGNSTYYFYYIELRIL